MNFQKFLRVFYDDVIYRDGWYLWLNEEIKIGCYVDLGEILKLGDCKIFPWKLLKLKSTH